MKLFAWADNSDWDKAEARQEFDNIYWILTNLCAITNLEIEEGATIYYVAPTFNATITTNWEGTSAPYTQTITVQGIKASDTPVVGPIYSNDLQTALLQQAAWTKISKIVTDVNKIIVICFEEKPDIDIPIQIKVV